MYEITFQGQQKRILVITCPAGINEKKIRMGDRCQKLQSNYSAILTVPLRELSYIPEKSKREYCIRLLKLT